MRDYSVHAGVCALKIKAVTKILTMQDLSRLNLIIGNHTGNYTMKPVNHMVIRLGEGAWDTNAYH